MSKELPKMYYNNISKEINNNSSFYSTLSDSRGKNVISNDLVNKGYDRFKIEQKIFDIFNSSDYIYKADVVVVTEGGEFKKRIVGKNSTNLITIDNEYIPINSIRDIYKS